MKRMAGLTCALSAVLISSGSFGLVGCSDEQKSADTAAHAGEPVAGSDAAAQGQGDGDGDAEHRPIQSTDDPNTVLVEMEAFDVPPGEEVFKCQDFDNPFGGEDVAIGRSESDMTAGTHHLHVYYGANTPDRHIVDCEDPNEFRPMIHLATVPHQVSEYPEGMAAKLKGSAGIRMQSHYVNTSDKTLHARVLVKLSKVDPDTVNDWVGQMHFNRLQLSLPPGQTSEVTTSCTIPANFGPIGLVTGVSHMHRHGVHFNAQTSSGVTLIDTDEWDEAPPVDYPEPIMLNPGESIQWTCTYNNDTAQPITYGDSALKNEMCIYIARFISSPSGDDLECETPFASFPAWATKNVAGM